MDKQICLNRSVLDFMNSKITPKTTVLEFGSGWSSAWFANRCGQFLTLETNPTWYKNISADLRSTGLMNWEIILTPSRMMDFIQQVDSILRSKAFYPDLILVDCDERLRQAAASIGWNFLRPGGVLVFDDAQRGKHKTVVDWVANKAPDKGHIMKWQEGDIESAKERTAIAWQK